jgi:four helix bundle protein
MSISLKEANESEYWLELLHKSEIITDKMFNDYSPRVIELKKLLTSIINTSKSNK